MKTKNYISLLNEQPKGKKISLGLTLFLFTLLLTTFQNKLTAQIDIGYLYDSSWTSKCSVPDSRYLYIQGQANYPNSTSLDVYVNFGDGKDTIFTTTVSNFGSQGYFWSDVNHTYTSAGEYILTAIVTGPDFDADTLTGDRVFVLDTCQTISGIVYLDKNTNCIYDVGDILLPSRPVKISSGGNTVAYTYTDANGMYSAFVGVTGTYDIEVDNSWNQSYNVTCPSSGKYTITGSVSGSNDFGLTCSGGFDYSAHLYGWRFRPGFEGTICVNVLNDYCFPDNATVKVVLDPLLTYIGYDSAATNHPTLSGDTLIWTNVSINSSYNYFNQCVTVSTSTSAVIGDSICLKMIIETSTADNNPANNIIEQCFPIRNSWDPNDKRVVAAGQKENGNIPLSTTELTYTVRFQNEGNAEAVNIFIIDTLDSDIDPTSLRIVSYSHSMNTRISDGNIVRFNFNDINLADKTSNEPGSHGYVTYKVNLKSGLPIGTEVKNTAYIYFDFNPAVVTNTTVNTLSVFTGIASLTQGAQNINVFPNPSNGNAMINYELNDQSTVNINIYDVVGKKVMEIENSTKTSGKHQTAVNAGALDAGTYILQMNVNGQIRSERFVVTK